MALCYLSEASFGFDVLEANRVMSGVAIHVALSATHAHNVLLLRALLKLSISAFRHACLSRSQVIRTCRIVEIIQPLNTKPLQCCRPVC